MLAPRASMGDPAASRVKFFPMTWNVGLTTADFKKRDVVKRAFDKVLMIFGRAVRPDVLCLQEVGGVPGLRRTKRGGELRLAG